MEWDGADHREVSILDGRTLQVVRVLDPPAW
jgi:hypothetical protein